jgi:hypothetical protein
VLVFGDDDDGRLAVIWWRIKRIPAAIVQRRQPA